MANNYNTQNGDVLRHSRNVNDRDNPNLSTTVRCRNLYNNDIQHLQNTEKNTPGDAIHLQANISEQLRSNGIGSISLACHRNIPILVFRGIQFKGSILKKTRLNRNCSAYASTSKALTGINPQQKPPSGIPWTRQWVIFGDLWHNENDYVCTPA